MSRDPLLCDLETRSDPGRSLLFLLLNGSPSDKIALLIQPDREVESRFDGGCLLVNVISVETHSGLQSQNIPSSQSSRLQPILLSCGKELIPDSQRSFRMMVGCIPD